MAQQQMDNNVFSAKNEKPTNEQNVASLDQDPRNSEILAGAAAAAQRLRVSQNPEEIQKALLSGDPVLQAAAREAMRAQTEEPETKVG